MSGNPVLRGGRLFDSLGDLRFARWHFVPTQARDLTVQRTLVEHALSFGYILFD